MNQEPENRGSASMGVSAAMSETPQEKDELVSATYPPEMQKKKRLQTAAIILLSILCAALLTCIIISHAQLKKTKEENVLLSEQLESADAENTRLQGVCRNLQADYDALKDDLAQVEDELKWRTFDLDLYRKNIGFIIADSKYYHTLSCPLFLAEDSYWAHNIEYCAYLGYAACSKCH